ncbi:hypothetical protein DFJ66_8166 [Saccharothrix variisporea]|uniref:Uncharacterized protein n=1 Tax=Saccharothrix variisporea TaxID=543527 RepID=A0A495XNL1_9PSEU|nr:hypothetical protein DFJ66_8166 [Saccharothrix variisporea]
MTTSGHHEQSVVDPGAAKDSRVHDHRAQTRTVPSKP